MAGAFRLPEKTDELDRALKELKPRLVVIDPIVSFLDAGVQLSSDISVRRALMPLVRLAHRHGCAIVLIRHLNKAAGMRAIYRGASSIAWHTTLHHPVPEWSGLVSNLAFPYSPPHSDLGPVYEFTMNHVVALDDPLEVVSVDLERVGS